MSNFIPLSYCPIVIELTLVSDANEPLVNLSGDFTTANTSFLWNIEQPIITCDIHRLDDGLFAEYAEILEKQSLPITSDVPPPCNSQIMDFHISEKQNEAPGK